MNNPLQNVIVRVLIYVFSTLIGMIPVALAGFISINPDAGTLTIDLDAVSSAILIGLGLSGGIFAKFGKR